MFPTSAQFVDAAMAYAGTPYVLGAEHDLDAGFRPAAALDCSELVQAALADLGVSFPDGTWNQVAAVITISVDTAIATPGALLFTTGLPDHVAISRGDGTTIEARGRAYGTGVFPAHGRFVTAGLVPGVRYGPLVDPAPEPEEDPMLVIHHPTLRVTENGDPALYDGRKVWDFTYLPNDGQAFGPVRCASHICVRALVPPPKPVLVFCNGFASGQLDLPADGRTLTLPVVAPGLVSVVGSGIAVEARELWVRA